MCWRAGRALNPRIAAGNKSAIRQPRPDSMRRLIVMFSLLAASLGSAPALAQSRSQLGPLCTSENTPADKQIDACNKIIALKVFNGEQLATTYFWRAVGWNKNGDYA